MTYLVDPGDRFVAIMYGNGALQRQAVRMQPRQYGAAIADNEGLAVSADAPPVLKRRLEVYRLQKPQSSHNLRHIDIKHGTWCCCKYPRQKLHTKTM